MNENGQTVSVGSVDLLERTLIDRCLVIGYIPKMNGPTTASLAAWLEPKLGSRTIDDLTIRELLALKCEWSEWLDDLLQARDLRVRPLRPESSLFFAHPYRNFAQGTYEHTD